MSTTNTIPADMSIIGDIDAGHFAECRKAEVVKAITAVGVEYHAWMRSSEEDEPPPVSFWRKCVDLVRAIDRLPLPGFGSHWIKFEAFAAGLCRVMSGSELNEEISGDFWEAVQGVLEIPQHLGGEAKPPTVEPMAELFALGVSDEQIAKMTGHTVDEVRLEKSSPGCLTGQEGYAPPILAKHTQNRLAEVKQWPTGSAISRYLDKIDELVACGALQEMEAAAS